MGHLQLPMFFRHIRSHVSYYPISTDTVKNTKTCTQKLDVQFSLDLLTDEIGGGGQEMSSPAQVLVFDNEDHHMMKGR